MKNRYEYLKTFTMIHSIFNFLWGDVEETHQKVSGRSITPPPIEREQYIPEFTTDYSYTPNEKYTATPVNEYSYTPNEKYTATPVNEYSFTPNEKTKLHGGRNSASY